VKIKLDENIGERGRSVLVAGGHDVTTVHEQGMSGAVDGELASTCAREARALVTLDLDFANPIRFPPQAHAGIAVLRLPRRPTPDDLLDAIESLVQALRTQPLEGQLWIVERTRIREYDRNRSGLT
jgi:predicted nuclease of predicted toxin-antitoxin system